MSHEGFTDAQLGQLTKVLSALLDKKFDKHLDKHHAVIEKRFESIEKNAKDLGDENRKLKVRLSVMENRVHRSEAEVIGIPLEIKSDPVHVVLQLAKTAGLEIKKEHLYSARRTGPLKETNGIKCQDITVEFERIGNCDIFLNKIGALREMKNGLNARMASTEAQNVPIAVFRRLSKETKRLKWLAKQRAKALNYEFCWVSPAGKLCMKKKAEGKIFTISCEEDLLERK